MAYVIYEISLAKRQFATRLTTQSIDQARSELDTFFDQISHLINAEEKQYKSGFWEGQDLRKTILHYISLIDQYRPISSIGIADPSGYEFDLLPDSTGNQWLTRRVFADRWGNVEKWRRWEQGDSLRLLEQWEKPLSIDPRERPWFKGAVKTREIFWTTPYKYTTAPEIGVTASLQIPGNNSRSTILAFDLTLRDLNTFVSKLKLTKSQNVFVLTEDNSKVLALNRYDPTLDLSHLKANLLQSPKKLGNPALMNVLKTKDNQKPYNFKIDGENWWGVLKSYRVTPSHKINIVTVIPEKDFALEINRTLWIVPIAFLFILILSIIVVWNHNKLHRISNILSEKNDLISKQKRVLFSEVHHRVKNNLALISAFLELDLLSIENEIAGNHIRKNQQRIKVIAITQEVAYQSERLGSVPAKKLIAEIIKYLAPSLSSKIDCKQDVGEQIYININQALTYGLLINELLRIFAGIRPEALAESVTIKVEQQDSRLSTLVYLDANSTAREKYITALSDNEMLHTFLRQLGADIANEVEKDAAYTFDFALEEKKGIMSSTYYRS
jgi:two-component sensor histidine kinase